MATGGRSGSRLLPVVATLALIAGLAACSSPADAPSSTLPSVVPLPASSGPDGEAGQEAAVLAAYQGYWDTWLAANSPPDPDHPGLELFYTGTALERARSAIAGNLTRGVTFRRSTDDLYRHEAFVSSIQGGVALVDDCAVDDGIVVGTDGAVIDARVVTNRSVATLRRIAGEWRVADVEVMAQLEGAVPCDS